MNRPRREMSEWCCIFHYELSHWSSFSRVAAIHTLVPHLEPRATSYIPFLCCKCTDPTRASLCKLLLYLKVYHAGYQRGATSTENVLTLMSIFITPRPIKPPCLTGICRPFMPDHSRYNDIFSASPLNTTGYVSLVPEKSFMELHG